LFAPNIKKAIIKIIISSGNPKPNILSPPVVVGLPFLYGTAYLNVNPNFFTLTIQL